VLPERTYISRRKTAVLHSICTHGKQSTISNLRDFLLIFLVKSISNIHNYHCNPHYHRYGALCPWETTESYQREWSFPAVQIVHPVTQTVNASNNCTDGAVFWEECSRQSNEIPLRVGAEHAQHTGYCITRKINYCRFWRPQQINPFVCCYHVLTLESPLRKGFCFGENCPGLVGAKSIPFVNYDIAAYYSGDKLQYERERLYLIMTEAETGKDVRFQWKNMDGPGYETFEEERKKYGFGFAGRSRVPKPVMSYMPNDSWWRPQ